MGTTELEQLQDRLTELLCRLNVDQLKEVCTQCKVSPHNEKHTSIGAIHESVDKALEEEEHDVAETFLQYLLATASLRETALKPMGEERHEEELGMLQDAEMLVNFQKSTKMLEEEMSWLREKISRTPSSPELPFPRAPEVVIRREFRLNGQVGEPGQKDKLSYTNLMHHIEAGKRKGHSEVEIVEAVLKAATPGLSLRDMLEARSNLTLVHLKKILKAHLKENSTTDMFHRLVNISQDAKESP